MKNRKEKVGFIIITCFTLVFFSIFFLIKDVSVKQKTAFIDVVPGGSKLYIADDDLVINGWDSYGVTYFFIPSYAKITDISYERSNLKIYDKDGSLLVTPQFNTEQEVTVDTDDGQRIPYKIGFYQSDNLYTVNLDIPDNELDRLSRETYIPLSINVISPSGTTVCADSKAMIKGRGNSTWEQVLKKSFDIRLSEKCSVLNETRSEKWVLLGNAIDNTKICNKMAFDTASDIGMPYITESEWADVYINGLYNGSYLICREPDIGVEDLNIGDLQKENRVFFVNPVPADTGNIVGYDYNENVKDISGGYLFSVGEIFRERNCGFYLPSGVPFYMKSPNNASIRELQYICSFVTEIDSNIYDIPDNIDKYSFARRFLLDEVFFEADSRLESYYFYKAKDINMLYAGPCWDYDRLRIWMGPIDTSVTGSTLIEHQGEAALPWDCILMENAEYRDYVREVFEGSAELWNNVLNERIDGYFDKIHDSVQMDYVRWDKINEEAGVHHNGYYSLPESNIKFMKYMLYKRLCYLADQWELDYEFAAPSINDGTVHRIVFSARNETKEISVKDGDFISEDQLRQMDLSAEEGWINIKTEQELSVKYPVYEDAEYIN